MAYQSATAVLILKEFKEVKEIRVFKESRG